MSWAHGGSDEYKRRMDATDFGTRFTTDAGGQFTTNDSATVPLAWRWLLVSGGLYYFRLRQRAGAHYRVTKTALKYTTYVTGAWCVVDLAAVLSADNMSSFYDGSDGANWSSSERNGMWRNSHNLTHTRRRINNAFEDLTALSALTAGFYEHFTKGGFWKLG